MTKISTLISARGRTPALALHVGGREEPAAPTHDESPINILIVDDEPGNLIVLETVLDDPGYRLVRAQSPEQALLALVEEEFALLILDIRMPGMTGFELAQLIKQRKRTAHVPIIFLTAYYDKEQHEVQGYGSGAVDFLNKPVNPTVLRSKVAVFADLHRKNRAITQANESLHELTEGLEKRVAARTDDLRRANEKLQGVMDSITDGLLMLDRSARLTYCNAQGARMLGMRPEQLVGHCIWDLFPQLRTTKYFGSFQSAIDGRETVAFEEYFPAPLSVWLECHCYPSDEGLSVYCHDITDRREVEKRREQLLAAEQAARAEGERIARAKDEFLMSLSHELRTPLAAILGWSKALQQPNLDPATLGRGIDAIARNARAQSNLVNDLLDMSRIISGKLRLDMERVDLGAIAAAAAETARPAAQLKGVTICVQGEGRPAETWGDAMRLQQVASNLVTNAVKFTPSGGTVSLSTAREGASAVLTVSDNGEGIAPDFLPYLFDRFSQADSAGARVHGGLGLGLSIVKHLTELHDGEVTASSAGAGQGASFEVRLPLMVDDTERAMGDRPADASASASQEEDAPVDLTGLSVLLVDDDADLLEGQRRLLSAYGAIATVASSAAAALQHLRSGRFDVLLSDLGMPGTDGYTFIESVRSSLGLSAQSLPAAAVTGYVRDVDRQRALDGGYQAFLQRPLPPATLARVVFDLAQAARSPSVPSLEPIRLRALFVEDNLDLQEQIGWMLEQEGLDLVTCTTGESAELELAKSDFDVLVTDVSLPRMSGIDLARRALELRPRTWILFSTGYPFVDSLTELGPHVRALLKPFEAADLRRVVDEVRAARQATR
ncbi:MAG: response regulator [Pseudomonadota bacterium]